MLGSEVVVRSLAQRGVKTIFSLPGNQIMQMHDACIDAGSCHEQAKAALHDAQASQLPACINVAIDSPPAPTFGRPASTNAAH